MEVLNKEKVLEHAKSLIDEGKIDKAIAEYKKLSDLDPRDMRIKLRIAELMTKQKKINDAVKVYKEVADNYTDEGFYLKAVTVYKNILRLNPSLTDINYRLAELYEKMGLVKDAIHQYQILANSLEQKGDYDALTNVRHKMVELDPHNVANRIRLAETYQYRGMEDKSLDEYEKLVDEVKDSGTMDQLIELYEKILSYRPDNSEMIKALISAYHKRGEWKKIISHLEKKDKLLEGQTDLLLMLGDSYARLNQVESAKRRYMEAAEIFMDIGDASKAMDAYKEVLVVSPESEDELKELIEPIDGDLFDKITSEARERREKLEKLAARAAEEDIEGKEVPEEDTSDLGLPVRRLTEKEIEGGVSKGDAAYELGKAYHQMGLKDEAEPELKKAVSEYRKLIDNGYSDEKIVKKLQNAEKWLGKDIDREVVAEEIARKEDIKESQKERESSKDKMEKTAKVKEEKKRVKPKRDDKKEKDKKESEEKKNKRDKRMGFV